MKKSFICLLLLLFSFSVMSQKQANNWNFGNGLRLDFNSGAPVFVPGSNIFAPEGSASYSDEEGNLLFYTNGDTLIYNANDQVMFNMQNTGGNYGSMQSSVIIEAPCEPGKYYLFTMDGIDPTGNNNGLSYFKIDMSLNGGLGAVVQPGISLFANSLEGLCAIRHRNKTDYWILIHHNTIGMRVYKVTSSGVAFHSLLNYPPYGTKRVIKASPNGKKVFVLPDPDGSISSTSSQTGLLLDFDNTTGTLSNPQTYNALFVNSSGAFNYFEFSPDSRYVYLATNNTIQRFDLQGISITAKKIFDISTWSNSAAISQFQLGPDGNIYFCFFGQLSSTGQVVTELSRIRCPNSVSPLVERILPVPNFDFFLAMPNYPAWLFESYDTTYVSLGPDTVFLCDNNDTIALNALNPGATYQWSTGATTQTISVNVPGTYIVTVSGSCGTGRDTIVVLDCYGDIIADYAPCTFDSVIFSVISSKPVSSITWNFGDPNSGTANTSVALNPVHKFSSVGTYTITAVANFSCFTATLTKTIVFSKCDSLPEDCELILPNVITPNGDGVNDGFQPSSQCTFESYNLNIFDRWGKKIYKSTDALEIWNGKYDGTDVQGVVYYIFEYNFPSQNEKKESGFITIIR
jgi:gliding motility-associated-like protein